MVNNLLATLADKNYIDQAKQLFSSVYFNAGWKGDYMLLSYEIPEEDLQWFRDKGILIKRCEPIYNQNIAHLPPVVEGKFYLFSHELKKWQNIIFLDADIIVRASLDDLTRIKGFAAVQSLYNPKLYQHFIPSRKMNKKLFDRLKKDYPLKKLAFNTGVMAFSTDIIKGDTFSKLQELFDLYREVIFLGEQPIFNLFFHKNWTKLPLIYNMQPTFLSERCGVKPEDVKAVILHFPGLKPWDTKEYFYKEWRYNLDRAEQIDLNKIQKPAKVWSEAEIKKYSLYRERKRITLFLHRYAGLVGIFLKNNFPKLHHKIKRLKNGE